jgi:hypothetical protein
MDESMIVECAVLMSCVRHKERRAAKKSCRWSAITATLLAICFGIFQIFVSYEEFILPAPNSLIYFCISLSFGRFILPAPNSLTYFCISLSFGRFPILE